MSDTTTFRDLGVDEPIAAALAEVGITTPFPIQELTLPLALSGADIIGQARTGTGKTLGFGIPLLQRATPGGKHPQALVIVPTRELCLQVAEDLMQAGARRGVKVVPLYGGKAIGVQADTLADGADVVVGTPGRLLDLLRRRQLTLSEVGALVLDEADEMLDLGFLPDVEQLIAATKSQRQTLLFSATMPGEVVALARRYMDKPTFLRADVEEMRIAPQTRQYLFSCHRMDKPAVLARILQAPDRGLALVFCRTKRMADILAEELRERDVQATAIHSDLRQEARERALDRFRKGKIDVLVATEVAARGLDIDSVTHVVNYDCPADEKMYLHRIGRTGRAGAAGVAVTLAVWNELPRLEMIRRELDIETGIQEIFSTSPLLDELFSLPPREARKPVPEAPKARRAAPRTKGKAAAEDEAREAGALAVQHETPVHVEAVVADDKPATPVDEDGTADGARRSRGRRRRGSGRSAAERTLTGDTDTAPAGVAVDTEAADAGVVDAGVVDGEPAGAGARVRRRSRRGEPAADRAASTTGGAGGLADTTPSDVSDRADAPQDGDESPDGPRQRRRTRVVTTAPDRAPGAAAEERRRTRPPAGRGRGGSGGSDASQRSGRDSASRPASTRPGTARDGADRDARRQRDGVRRERDGARRDGGRGGRDSSDRNGRDARRDRYAKDRGPRRPAVDPEVARGDGTPRTTRPMVITHLP